MLERIENEADWERLVFDPAATPGTVLKVERLHLDFKGDITDTERKIAVPIAAMANAEGGIIAYGAIEKEDPRSGINSCTGTRDLGEPQGVAQTIRDVVKQRLWGIDPWPDDFVALRLSNGHRVLAVHVRPSVPIVACTLSGEPEKIRYPGSSRRASGVPSSARSGAAHPQLPGAGGDDPTAGLRGGNQPRNNAATQAEASKRPPPVSPDVAMMELRQDRLRLRLTRSTKHHRECFVEVPCDWIATTWWHDRGNNDVMPGLLIAAQISWNTLADRATLTPQQWLR